MARLLEKCKQAGLVDIEDSHQTADMIFVILDGAYCYLCLIDDESLYNKKMQYYKEQAIKLLRFTSI